MGDLTFNVFLSLFGFLAILRCLHRDRQHTSDKLALHRSHQELLGQIQGMLAKVSGDIDRLRHVIPESQAPEAHAMTQRLVRTIDEIILITRHDWAA